MTPKNNEIQDDFREEEHLVEFKVWYFFIISLACFLVPFYICLALFLTFYFFINYVLALGLQLQFFLFPVVLFFLYYIYLILLIELVALWTMKWNKKCPPQQGTFERDFMAVKNKTEIGKILNFYHKRGFIIKFPMWLTSKSPFPWLINRTLRRIGHNKIAKNVIYCDAYAGLEFTDIGENTFIYPTSVLSSHEVNSIFGNLNILEIKIGKNNSLFPGTVVGPGAVSEDCNVFLPGSMIPKGWKGVYGCNYYRGAPAKPSEFRRDK
ncbi:MAG: hypothetical protein JW891_03035 [Candidatus Lokiarchaeota archaeon]|nr:hypothetical protein [Candidatus Lokiarchaeota archaeon]